jgi:hypothetical protein
MRASGVSAALCRFLLGHDHDAAAPSFRPEALPAVTVPSFDEGGLQLLHRLQRGAVADIFVLSTTTSPLRPLT